ncbi:helix-turn-helix transcriptional regulator [Siphonobacter sp. SORGH_AS_1065]|uniref:helix-turn-helix transcriptional regulator n=1 Tax=Siphonobacter sp. SORGH_AS_1065 TaxID=3041795 RepID=UPI0027863219|nr:helix-turn-helix transcriptional regulator [Siphonobacter sp. SORGH_AS_1065]MDQ1087448.1 transcriptional regulator with XRE-family HTH domain [Siphonobacter sp. SORGH_AS_1065]
MLIDIGSILIKARRQLRLSQQEVAESLGVSQSTYSSWEAGKAFPSLEQRIILAELLRIPTESLLGEEMWKRIQSLIGKKKE